MKFVSDRKLKAEFVKSLRESYEEREGIHVSDLIYCLRESFFRRVNPKPATETQLMYFLDGARRHIALQSLTGSESEVEVERYGVKGTIDIKDNVPVEFKSTRARQALPDHYFTQLGYYCVLCGVDNGVLMVQRLNNREVPFEVYTVQFSLEEMKSMKEDMIMKRGLLEYAVQRDSPDALPDAEHEWKCKNCLYREECQ